MGNSIYNDWSPPKKNGNWMPPVVFFLLMIVVKVKFFEQIYRWIEERFQAHIDHILFFDVSWIFQLPKGRQFYIQYLEGPVSHWRLVVEPTDLKKYARQNENLPQGSGWKSKNIWNHHLVIVIFCVYIFLVVGWDDSSWIRPDQVLFPIKISTKYT